MPDQIITACLQLGDNVSLQFLAYVDLRRQEKKIVQRVKIVVGFEKLRLACPGDAGQSKLVSYFWTIKGLVSLGSKFETYIYDPSLNEFCPGV